MEQSKALRGTRTFLELEQVEPENLFVVGNDFARAGTAIRFTDGTNPEFYAAANRMPE
ncbi:hypothetical protein ACHHV8_07470 [Paenibacillus sp. TAB 01]|uniref:hypothetical protein n=1 Tax=Paenibacillus sp. TAB 01 TaxID=3368988 RepID=UPI0037519212